jgi:DNA-binding transcriptional MerR regulator
MSVSLWPTCVLVLAVFGLFPGFVLRAIVRVYPRDHERRRELIAELYGVEFQNRPLWVVQQIETAVCEGIPARWRQRRATLASDARSARGEQGFGAPQACSIVGITNRQLDYWAHTDLIRPSVTEVRGTGRRYSYRDLLELKVVKRLLDAGISLQSARWAVEVLRHEGDEVMTAKLVLDGPQSVLATTGSEILDLLKGGRGVLKIISLTGVVSELEAAIVDVAAGATDRTGPGARKRARTILRRPR